MADHKLKEVQIRLKMQEGSSLFSKVPLDSPSSATNVMKDLLKDMDREMVCVVNLDHRLRPINYNIVSLGSLNESIVPIQNVYKSCILSNASAIMLFHNHPSGEVIPSDRDFDITKKLIEVGKLMEIPLIDHIIVGSGTANLYSFHSDHEEMFQGNIDFKTIQKIQDSVKETGTHYKGETMNEEEKMNFDEFKHYIEQHILGFLPDEMVDRSVVTIQRVNKLGGSYTGLSLKTVENTISSTVVNLDQYFENYQNGWDMYPVLSKMSDQLTQNEFEISVDWLLEYENIKNCLFVRISNRESNASVLDNVPHQNYTDLALTYHIQIDTEKESLASTMINNDMLKTYGISLEQLHADAIENSAKLYHPRLARLTNFLEDSYQVDFSSMPLAPDTPELMILTNDAEVHGAATLFYPGVMRELSDRLHGSYYILPSSIHEVLLVNDVPSIDYHKLENTVKEINKKIVEPKEVLSDHVYHYDAKERVFELANTYDERKRSSQRESLLKRLDSKKQVMNQCNTDKPVVKTDKQQTL